MYQIFIEDLVNQTRATWQTSRGHTRETKDAHNNIIRLEINNRHTAYIILNSIRLDITFKPSLFPFKTTSR